MAAEKIKLLLYKLLITMGFIGIFAGFATAWSIRPAVNAGMAMAALDTSKLITKLSRGDLTAFDARRAIQMHFLDYDIYLPLEDIVPMDTVEDPESRSIFLMRNVCGESKLYIWIPLTIRLPLYGNSVWEFCWTPT